MCFTGCQGVLREVRACRLGSDLKQLALQLPASHPLQRLDLTACCYLREVTIVSAQLRELQLNNCRTLYRLRVR